MQEKDSSIQGNDDKDSAPNSEGGAADEFPLLNCFLSGKYSYDESSQASSSSDEEDDESAQASSGSDGDDDEDFAPQESDLVSEEKNGDNTEDTEDDSSVIFLYVKPGSSKSPTRRNPPRQAKAKLTTKITPASSKEQALSATAKIDHELDDFFQSNIEIEEESELEPAQLDPPDFPDFPELVTVSEDRETDQSEELASSDSKKNQEEGDTKNNQEEGDTLEPGDKRTGQSEEAAISDMKKNEEEREEIGLPGNFTTVSIQDQEKDERLLSDEENSQKRPARKKNEEEREEVGLPGNFTTVSIQDHQEKDERLSSDENTRNRPARPVKKLLVDSKRKLKKTKQRVKTQKFKYVPSLRMYEKHKFYQKANFSVSSSGKSHQEDVLVMNNEKLLHQENARKTAETKELSKNALKRKPKNYQKSQSESCKKFQNTNFPGFADTSPKRKVQQFSLHDFANAKCPDIFGTPTSRPRKVRIITPPDAGKKFSPEAEEQFVLERRKTIFDLIEASKVVQQREEHNEAAKSLPDAQKPPSTKRYTAWSARSLSKKSVKIGASEMV